MNLRIANAPGLVAILDHVLDTVGDAEGLPEVGGPYATLGALLKDAGRLEHGEYAEPGDEEPIWEVVEWQGVWFTIHKNCFDSPSRHASKEAAMKAGGKGGRGRT